MRRSAKKEKLLELVKVDLEQYKVIGSCSFFDSVKVPKSPEKVKKASKLQYFPTEFEFSAKHPQSPLYTDSGYGTGY